MIMSDVRDPHKSNWCGVGVHEMGNQAGGKELQTHWLHVVLVLSERIPSDVKNNETWRYIYTLIAPTLLLLLVYY